MARNYRHEAAIEDPARKAERASRNRSRRKLVKVHGKAAMAGKQTEHKDGNALNNRMSNLKPISPKANNQGRRGGSATGNR